MNKQPAIPARTSLLACLLAAACSGKTVALDQPQTETSGGSPNEGDHALVLEHQGRPLMHNLVADETRLYWITTGGVLQGCLKQGCQETVTTYAEHVDTNANAGFAVSAGTIFWLGDPERGTIYACPTDGCEGEPRRLLRDPTLDGEAGITAHEGRVYWLSAHDLYRCSASGCTSTGEVIPLGEGALPQFFRGDAYWLHMDTPPPSNGLTPQTTWSIRRAPQDAFSGPSTAVEVTESIREFALGLDHIYWINANDQLMRCPLPGCERTPETVEAGPGRKIRLSADESGVYWLREDEGDIHHDAVHYCSHAGCSDDTAFVTIDELVNYTIDSQFIYLVDHGRDDIKPLGGFIHRTPKPR